MCKDTGMAAGTRDLRGRRKNIMDSKKLTMVLAALLIALILPAAAMAAPAVSVECAYSDPHTDLVCEVYVNTDSRSAAQRGVLGWATMPTELTVSEATKDPA